jgi:hypothetical protein
VLNIQKDLTTRNHSVDSPITYYDGRVHFLSDFGGLFGCFFLMNSLGKSLSEK